MIGELSRKTGALRLLGVPSGMTDELNFFQCPPRNHG